MSEWQPIETAPKGANGYAWMFLAWGPEEDKSTGKGMWCVDRFIACATFHAMGKTPAFEFRQIEVSPTHWMPLPEPPQ